jgi:DNA-binding NarL/FixJ family response regulator
VQIKLMLVDDHLLFMEGLQYLLETNGIQVIGKARNGREALIKARILNPDIILMDIRMPECNGVDALKLIKAEMPEIKIIMLTTSEEDEDLFNAIKFGASGYLLKNTDAKELIQRIKQTSHNEASISPDLAVKLLNEIRLYNRKGNKFSQKIPQKEEQTQLTDRQLEILMMVAEGKTYKEVGEIIGLKERTIKYHMGKMLECLHLDNRSQVIAYASRNRMIDH